MEFLELAKKRYSCRKYKNREVEPDKLGKVLEAGRIAPSAANFQPWHFIVIRDEKLKSQIHETYGRSWFSEAPVIIVICADHSKSWKRGDGKDHADIDVAIATDHMTLQAAELDLATCWICHFDAEKCSRILNLPDHIEPAVYLPLGYPDDQTSKNHEKRDEFDKIVHWDKY